MNKRLFDFLKGMVRDPKGRLLRDLQFLKNHRLERDDDAICWMFPIDGYSKRYPRAVILSEDELSEIKVNVSIRCAFKISLARMNVFYKTNTDWITQNNHNFIRLARILRCLWLAGLKVEYVKLQKFLDEVYLNNSDIIELSMFLHWKRTCNETFNLDDYNITPTISVEYVLSEIRNLNKNIDEEEIVY